MPKFNEQEVDKSVLKSDIKSIENILIKNISERQIDLNAIEEKIIDHRKSVQAIILDGPTSPLAKQQLKSELLSLINRIDTETKLFKDSLIDIDREFNSEKETYHRKFNEVVGEVEKNDYYSTLVKHNGSLEITEKFTQKTEVFMASLDNFIAALRNGHFRNTDYKPYVENFILVTRIESSISAADTQLTRSSEMLDNLLQKLKSSGIDNGACEKFIKELNQLTKSSIGIKSNLDKFSREFNDLNSLGKDTPTNALYRTNSEKNEKLTEIQNEIGRITQQLDFIESAYEVAEEHQRKVEVTLAQDTQRQLEQRLNEANTLLEVVEEACLSLDVDKIISAHTHKRQDSESNTRLRQNVIGKYKRLQQSVAEHKNIICGVDKKIIKQKNIFTILNKIQNRLLKLVLTHEDADWIQAKLTELTLTLDAFNEISKILDNPGLAVSDIEEVKYKIIDPVFVLNIYNEIFSKLYNPKSTLKNISEIIEDLSLAKEHTLANLAKDIATLHADAAQSEVEDQSVDRDTISLNQLDPSDGSLLRSGSQSSVSSRSSVSLNASSQSSLNSDIRSIDVLDAANQAFDEKYSETSDVQSFTHLTAEFFSSTKLSDVLAKINQFIQYAHDLKNDLKNRETNSSSGPLKNEISKNLQFISQKLDELKDYQQTITDFSKNGDESQQDETDKSVIEITENMEYLVGEFQGVKEQLAKVAQLIEVQADITQVNAEHNALELHNIPDYRVEDLNHLDGTLNKLLNGPQFIYSKLSDDNDVKVREEKNHDHDRVEYAHNSTYQSLLRKIIDIRVRTRQINGQSLKVHLKNNLEEHAKNADQAQSDLVAILVDYDDIDLGSKEINTAEVAEAISQYRTDMEKAKSYIAQHSADKNNLKKLIDAALVDIKEKISEITQGQNPYPKIVDTLLSVQASYEALQASVTESSTQNEMDLLKGIATELDLRYASVKKIQQELKTIIPNFDKYMSQLAVLEQRVAKKQQAARQILSDINPENEEKVEGETEADLQAHRATDFAKFQADQSKIIEKVETQNLDELTKNQEQISRLKSSIESLSVAVNEITSEADIFALKRQIDVIFNQLKQLEQQGDHHEENYALIDPLHSVIESAFKNAFKSIDSAVQSIVSHSSTNEDIFKIKSRSAVLLEQCRHLFNDLHQADDPSSLADTYNAVTAYHKALKQLDKTIFYQHDETQPNLTGLHTQFLDNIEEHITRVEDKLTLGKKLATQLKKLQQQVAATSDALTEFKNTSPEAINRDKIVITPIVQLLKLTESLADELKSVDIYEYHSEEDFVVQRVRPTENKYSNIRQQLDNIKKIATLNENLSAALQLKDTLNFDGQPGSDENDIDLFENSLGVIYLDLAQPVKGLRQCRKDTRNWAALQSNLDSISADAAKESKQSIDALKLADTLVSMPDEKVVDSGFIGLSDSINKLNKSIGDAITNFAVHNIISVKKSKRLLNDENQRYTEKITDLKQKLTALELTPDEQLQQKELLTGLENIVAAFDNVIESSSTEVEMKRLQECSDAIAQRLSKVFDFLGKQKTYNDAMRMIDNLHGKIAPLQNQDLDDVLQAVGKTDGVGIFPDISNTVQPYVAEILQRRTDICSETLQPQLDDKRDAVIAERRKIFNQLFDENINLLDWTNYDAALGELMELHSNARTSISEQNRTESKVHQDQIAEKIADKKQRITSVSGQIDAMIGRISQFSSAQTQLTQLRKLRNYANCLTESFDKLGVVLSNAHGYGNIQSCKSMVDVLDRSLQRLTDNVNLQCAQADQKILKATIDDPNDSIYLKILKDCVEQNTAHITDGTLQSIDATDIYQPGSHEVKHSEFHLTDKANKTRDVLLIRKTDNSIKIMGNNDSLVFQLMESLYRRNIEHDLWFSKKSVKNPIAVTGRIYCSPSITIESYVDFLYQQKDNFDISLLRSVRFPVTIKGKERFLIIKRDIDSLSAYIHQLGNAINNPEQAFRDMKASKRQSASSCLPMYQNAQRASGSISPGAAVNDARNGNDVNDKYNESHGPVAKKITGKK